MRLVHAGTELSSIAERGNLSYNARKALILRNAMPVRGTAGQGTAASILGTSRIRPAIASAVDRAAARSSHRSSTRPR